MSNIKQKFSRNLQQEQKEFERKAKQVPVKENKKQPQSNHRNKKINSYYGQDSHYQKETHESKPEVKVSGSYKNKSVYTDSMQKNASTYQPRINKNVKNEQEGFQKKQNRQTVKESDIDLTSKQDYNFLYYDSQYGRNSGHTNSVTYNSNFNQNIIKEEEEYQIRQKQQQFKMVTVSEIKNYPNNLSEHQKTKSEEKNSSFRGENLGKSASYNQEYGLSIDSGENPIRVSSRNKTEVNTPIRKESIENNDVICGDSVRTFGPLHSSKEQLNLKNIQMKSTPPCRITGIEQSLLKHENEPESKGSSCRKDMQVYPKLVQTKPLTYLPHFNQNIIKEEVEFQKGQKQQQSIKDMDFKINSHISNPLEHQKIKADEEVYRLRSASSEQKRVSNIVSGQKTVRKVFMDKTEANFSTRMDSTENGDLISVGGVRRVGALQLQKRQLNLKDIPMKSMPPCRIAGIEKSLLKHEDELGTKASSSRKDTQVYPRLVQTKPLTYLPHFNQNIIKEENAFKRSQKQQQSIKDTEFKIKSHTNSPLEHQKIKADEEKHHSSDEKHDKSIGSHRERTSSAVSGKETISASFTRKAGESTSTRIVSIDNSNSIPFGRMRLVGAKQPKKGELNLKNIHTPSMLPYRITGIEKNLLAAGVKYLIGTAYKGTDTQKGVEYATDIYATSGQFITDQIRIAMTKSMIRESNSVLRIYHDILKKTCGENGVTSFGIIGNISSYKDVMRMQKGVNSILIAKYGKGIKGTGWAGYVNAMRFLRKNKGQLDPEIRKLIRETFKRTSAIQMFKGNVTQLRAIKRLGMRKIRRYLQQTDTGYGMYFTLDIISRTKSILRGAVFAIRSIMKAAEKATLIAVKTSAWAVAKGIKYGSKLVPKVAKETKAAKKIVNGAKKVGSGYKKAKGAASKSRGKVAKVRQNIQKFQRNPFGIRTGMNKLGKKATDALSRRLNKTILAKPARVLGKGYRYINKVISAIGRTFSFVGTAISTIIHIVLMGLLLLILCGFLVSIISTIFTMFFSVFDFNTHKKEIREACLEQIEESYKEQTEEITKLRRKYRNMTIDYKDLKDEDVYEEKDIAIRETTNSAEILSMATVYFDFDLEKAGKRKAKKYVKELYNGSHLVSIVEKPYTYEDSEGKEVTVKDANVTLTTYYFNHLFNCELKSGSGVIAGSEITEQVWNYLRSAGVPAVQVAGIMGNMQAESGFNPNIIEYGNGIGFGLCQWSYGRRTALENYAASKGKPPGDLEIQLEFLLTELGPGNFNSYHTGENNYNGFMNASDPETAAYYFMWGWERPAVWAGNSSIQMRQTAARTFYDNYIDREIITEEPEEDEEPEK